MCIRSKANSEPRYTVKMDLFAKIVNGFSPLTVFVKSSISDICLGSKYLSTNIKAIVKFLKKPNS